MAQKAGLLPGDRISAVNMQSVMNIEYQSAINIIKNAGPEYSMNIIRAKLVGFFIIRLISSKVEIKTQNLF